MQSILLQQQKQQQIIIEKNGLKIIKQETNKFNLTFDLVNKNILLPAIINFNLIKLLNKLNENLFESMDIENETDANITINILLKDVFSDLGLPHYYLALNINNEKINSNKIVFNCRSFENKLDKYTDDIELIPIYDIIINFNIIDDHTVIVSSDIILNDNHNIPSFFEKIIGNLFYNIFYKLKQFIENVSF